MKKLKTLTVGVDSEDNPQFSILKGRHSIKTFNKAFKNEGWDDSDGFTKDMVTYEWIRKLKNSFRITDQNDLKAEIYTVGHW